MSNPVGRPPNLVRDAWMMRFSLSEWSRYKIPDSLLGQLSCCKSDEARRIILGISK